MRMKTIAVLIGLLFTLPALAQQAAPVPPEFKAADYFIGRWEGDLMMGPPGGQMKMKAAMVGEKILGGRYIQCMNKFSGDGMPEMSGMFLLTYDEAAKNWVGWWYDSTGPGAVEMPGSLVDNTITLTSKPTKMQGMDVTMRSTWTKVSDKELKMKVEMQQGTDWVVFVSGEFKKK